MYTHLFRPAKPMRTFTVGFQTFKTTNEVDFTSAVWLLFRPVQVDDARVYRSLDPPNAIEPPLNAAKARYFKSLRLCNECFLILPCPIREKNTAVGQHYTPFSRHQRPLLSTSTQRCRRLHQENTSNQVQFEISDVPFETWNSRLHPKFKPRCSMVLEYLPT